MKSAETDRLQDFENRNNTIRKLWLIWILSQDITESLLAVISYNRLAFYHTGLYCV